MVTYGMMLVLIFSLIFILLFQAKISDNSEHFFNISNTQAMRGFWCIIIMLVHVPSMYTNPLQDMMGSFAYIGVTFFFMVSAYGLKQKTNILKHFWRRRLPKLLAPCLISNIFLMGVSIICGEQVKVKELLFVNRWVLWLIVCYAIYWFAYRFINNSFSDYVVIIGILLVSVIMYLLKLNTSIVTWSTEVWGFVWGMLLAKYRDEILKVTKNKWIIKEGVCILIAGILGLLYLKYKYVVIWGDYLLKIVLGITILLVILIANTYITIGNRISHFLGKISYEIYLIHGRVFLHTSFYFPNMNSGVYIFISIMMTIILSVIIHCVCALMYRTVEQIIIKNR